MTALLIVTIAVLVVVVHRQRKQFQVYRLPPVYEEPPRSLPDLVDMDKLEQKAAQREQERALALADVERWECLKLTYIAVLEAVEKELQYTADPKRITTLLSKQATYEERCHRLDRKIEIASFKANKAA